MKALQLLVAIIWVTVATSCNAQNTSKKENTASNSDKIKIPNVCENMNVRCINDFKFIREVNIRFTCQFI